MTILSPSMLWFLGAISIPVLIHFLSRLRVKKVEFSTIRFIKALETSSIRKVQIQQLILLLLRVLAIGALVMMISKPVTQGLMPGWVAAEQDAHIIVVLDNSASMNALQEGETQLEQSKSGFLSIITKFKKETTVSIFQTNPPSMVFHGAANHPGITQAVLSIKETHSSDLLWDRLQSFMIDLDVKEPIKECIIFSDFMVPPDSSTFSKILEIDDWKFYFIHTNPVYDNLSIQSVSSVNRMKTISQLVKLNTRIQNTGELQKVNIPLELLFDDQRVGQVVSEFDAGKEKEFLFQAYPGDKGIVKGEVVLPNDHYALDNVWHIAMPIMDQIECGVIGATPEDVSMMEMVLKAIDPQSQFISIDSRIHPNLNRLFIDELDVVIIHRAMSISEEAVNQLEAYLKSGGGIIWFQGDLLADEAQKRLTEKVQFPTPQKIVQSGQGFFSTQLNGNQSDLLQNISIRQLEDELPEVFQYSKLKSTVKHKIHWTLNNDDPLLLEFSVGRGRVFYVSSLLDLRWNDLAIRGMVIPFIYQLMVLTGTDEINTSPVYVDEPKWISIDEKMLRYTWEIESPSGRKELIVPDYNSEGINITSTQELGIYRVYANGDLFTAFPSQLHPNEHIQPRISESNLSSLLPDGRWLLIQDDFTSVFTEARQGKSLWKAFLIAAIGLLLLESILGRPEHKTMKKPE